MGHRLCDTQAVDQQRNGQDQACEGTGQTDIKDLFAVSAARVHADHRAERPHEHHGDGNKKRKAGGDFVAECHDKVAHLVKEQDEHHATHIHQACPPVFFKAISPTDQHRLPTARNLRLALSVRIGFSLFDFRNHGRAKNGGLPDIPAVAARSIGGEAGGQKKQDWQPAATTAAAIDYQNCIQDFPFSGGSGQAFCVLEIFSMRCFVLAHWLKDTKTSLPVHLQSTEGRGRPIGRTDLFTF